MKKNADSSFVWIIGFALLLVHMAIIAEDIQTVIEDTNRGNKPREILKLAIDITRYIG